MDGIWPKSEAYSLFADMLDGRIPALELGALLASLRWKNESADELSGFARALNERVPVDRTAAAPAPHGGHSGLRAGRARAQPDAAARAHAGAPRSAGAGARAGR
jgi:anthranilate phosphoribosyltransferase